jgi:hypothetical protein
VRVPQFSILLSTCPQNFTFSTEEKIPQSALFPTEVQIKSLKSIHTSCLSICPVGKAPNAFPTPPQTIVPSHKRYFLYMLEVRKLDKFTAVQFRKSRKNLSAGGCDQCLEETRKWKGNTEILRDSSTRSFFQRTGDRSPDLVLFHAT